VWQKVPAYRALADDEGIVRAGNEAMWVTGTKYSVQPDGRELAAPVRESHVHVPPGPAERDGVDVLLAVLGPHDAGSDRHRLVERVLWLAGPGRVWATDPPRAEPTGTLAAHPL